MNLKEPCNLVIALTFVVLLSIERNLLLEIGFLLVTSLFDLDFKRFFTEACHNLFIVHVLSAKLLLIIIIK
jgi:hypothetical protein